MDRQKDPQKPQSQRQEGITQISVSGFKSISREQSIEIRPLTILAGANSSGKSSVIQPLLLMKQTLEASYDPGALLLDGPNVQFTSFEQLLSRTGKGEISDTFTVGISTAPGLTLSLSFQKHPDGGVGIQRERMFAGGATSDFHPGMTHEDIVSVVSFSPEENLFEQRRPRVKWVIVRNRCFLHVMMQEESGRTRIHPVFGPGLLQGFAIEREMRELIHLPGLRGNPERTYPMTAVGSAFPGTFEKYVASVIARWQTKGEERKLAQLRKDLERLGLTWTVTAKPLNDTQVELKIGRLIHPTKGKARDLINIADVGVGVSQALPVLVALLAAEPEQLVYIEQPEIHLHPRAQFAMAQVLADAANRGVRVIVETHSDLLLLGIRTLVAEGRLPPEKIKLHWFRRDNKGETRVSSADLDEAGAFGDWPEDFAEVELKAESRYLDAAEVWGRKNGRDGRKVEAPRH